MQTKQRHIGRAEVAELLDISPRWASTLVHAGIPHRKLRDGNTVFLWPAALAWWIERCVKQRDAKAKPANRDALELRKLAAEVKMIEMTAAERAAMLVTRRYYNAQHNAMLARLAAVLTTFPAEVASKSLGLLTIAAAEEFIEGHVYALMARLAGTATDIDPDEGAELDDEAEAVA